MCALRLLADTFSFCHKTGLNTATAVSDILRQYQTSSWPLQNMSVIDVVRGGCLVGDPRLKFDVIACVRPSRRFRIQWTEYNIHAEIALRGVRT